MSFNLRVVCRHCGNTAVELNWFRSPTGLGRFLFDNFDADIEVGLKNMVGVKPMRDQYFIANYWRNTILGIQAELVHSNREAYFWFLATITEKPVAPFEISAERWAEIVLNRAYPYSVNHLTTESLHFLARMRYLSKIGYLPIYFARTVRRENQVGVKIPLFDLPDCDNSSDPYSKTAYIKWIGELVRCLTLLQKYKLYEPIVTA